VASGDAMAGSPIQGQAHRSLETSSILCFSKTRQPPVDCGMREVEVDHTRLYREQ